MILIVGGLGILVALALLATDLNGLSGALEAFGSGWRETKGRHGSIDGRDLAGIATGAADSRLENNLLAEIGVEAMLKDQPCEKTSHQPLR